MCRSHTNVPKIVYIVVIIAVVGAVLWISTYAPAWKEQYDWSQLPLIPFQGPEFCNRQCNASCRQQQEMKSNQTLPDIWFIESTLRNGICLNERQACAVESAALRNPNLTVNLLLTGPMANRCSTLRTLSAIPNFRAAFFDVRTEFRDTPLEPWYKRGKWKTAKNKVEDMSDALRWLVLWKHGGVYLDLDVIVLKRLHELKNGGAYQNPGFRGTAVLFFDKWHPFLNEIQQTCVREYKTAAWGSCGPTLFDHVHDRWTAANSSPPVSMLPSEMFYAIRYNSWEKFFRTNYTAEVFHAVRNSLGVHVWNKMSRVGSVQVGSGSAYDLLARFNCPLIYEAMVARKVL
ncbi:lactosylceramide 4-alpha-galactosyltransferase-like [Amblyomma americanum]